MKTRILYIAIDSKDADFILNELIEKIDESVNVEIDLRHKTLQTDNYIVNVRSIHAAIPFPTRHCAKYVVLSDRPFNLKLHQVKDLVQKLQDFRMHTSITAKEIDIYCLLDILNADSKKYCSTCKWYSVDEGVCCNRDSDFRADFRCLDDSCELWEETRNENL